MVWRVAEAFGMRVAAPPRPAAVCPDGIALRSATACHPAAADGRDTFLERPDRGLWAIADPLGDRPADRIAAVAAIAALADLGDAGADAIRAVLGLADVAIRATRSRTGRGSGATVVALHLDPSAATLLWAGDGHGYRWRDGAIRRLSGDHGRAPEAGDGSSRLRGAATAIGGALPAEIATARVRVASGDRLLLCSPALAAALPIAMIARRLAAPPTDAVDALVEAALCAGARGALSGIAIAVD